jgi:hypothetical protein
MPSLTWILDPDTVARLADAFGPMVLAQRSLPVFIECKSRMGQ